MRWKVTSEPAAEPVTLAQAKTHMRITDPAEDDYITALIKGSRKWCEGYQNRAYITQTIKLYMDRFPRTILLPRPLAISVTSITYVDTAGATQTLSTDVYDLDAISQPGVIFLKHSQIWPAVRGDRNGIIVTITAGYGAAAAVPDDIVHAIKLMTAHLYEFRQPVSEISTTMVPMSVKSLLSMERAF